MSIRDFVTSELEVTNSDFADEPKQYTIYWAMLEDYLKLSVLMTLKNQTISITAK
jgi:hypothetical protein